MCGLTGFHSPASIEASGAIGARMADTLAHRGPDDAGVWVDEQCGLVLAHRRLAVLELSPAGGQPMHSPCSRYVIAFNGEIYNHMALRRQLESRGQAPAWRGHSDTETLLACFAAWGAEATLRASVGMFAIALWDRRERTLTLARDRLGEKPLYWGWQGDTLLFGSELKALKAHPAFMAGIDRGALALLMRHGYVPAPRSIYEGIGKLPCGHSVRIPLDGPDDARQATPAAYWRMNDVIHAGLADPFLGTASEGADALEQSLMRSVKGQMVSDVPLGAFLSGGVDSSLVVALMQAQSSRPVRTFTIGFDDARHNEAGHARQVARHLGTDHTELCASPRDALDLIPGLPAVYDEPFADSSQIPTLLVSRLARRHVTVALSGDAGDELFGGYNTYRFVPALWRRIGGMPLPLRRAAARCLAALPDARAQKLARVMDSPGREELYRRVSSHWPHPEAVALRAAEPPTPFSTPHAWPAASRFEDWMMAMGAQTYLPDDILVKVDRASMAHSLEVRVPMLDHRVLELAWRLPLDMKIRDGKGKWLLREVLYRHVPRELIERPKKGFSVPLAAWLRGPLRDWADAMLDPSRLRAQGYFDPAAVRQAWRRHQQGKEDLSSRLWCVLMFQSWLQEQR